MKGLNTSNTYSGPSESDKQECKQKQGRESEHLKKKTLGENASKQWDIIISALLFGLGWHLRGSGTSDPTVPMLWFLLFVMIVFPDKHFSYSLMGWTLLIFRLGRRGWGTFVSQVGWPGEYTAILYTGIGTDWIEVAWWQGYFWLFMVGIAWVGPASFLLGGYFFSNKSFNKRDYFSLVLLYIIGALIGRLIARSLIPLISPEAYYDVYVAGLSTRNYNSMLENLSLALAMIPVLLYIAFVKKEPRFCKRMTIIMLIFGFAFSFAAIWQMIGRGHLELNIPFWSLWEYFSGFIIGALLLKYYKEQPHHLWREDLLSPVVNTNKEKNRFKQFFNDYFLGHFMVFLFAIQETLFGSIRLTLLALGYEWDWPSWVILAIVVFIDLPFYLLHKKGKLFSSFTKKPTSQKARIYLLILVSFSYFAWMIQFIVSGSLFQFNIGYTMQWLNTFSYLTIMIYLLRGLKQS